VKIRGSCSHPVGHAGARREEVVRATKSRLGVKSGGVKGENEVKGEGVKPGDITRIRPSYFRYLRGEISRVLLCFARRDVTAQNA
jgi:hypothetical protein